MIVVIMPFSIRTLSIMRLNTLMIVSIMPHNKRTLIMDRNATLSINDSVSITNKRYSGE